MIKALDTIGTKRMNSKTTEIQKTIAEKVKITAFNQPIDRIPSVDCLWIPIFADKRAARMTGIAASVNKLSGKTIERDAPPPQGMFSCTHCGFVTQYQVELDVHMKIHYL